LILPASSITKRRNRGFMSVVASLCVLGSPPENHACGIFHR
jgi:hypothetical protein